MTERHKSAAPVAVHEGRLALLEAGLISKERMREYDEACLEPVEEVTPEDIHALRLRENASPTVFARFLSVTPGLVRQGGAGKKRPSGPSLKLLALVAKNGLHAVA